MKNICAALIITLTTLFSPTNALADSKPEPSVLLLAPTHGMTEFWLKMIEIMEAAAINLNIDFKARFLGADPLTIVDSVKSLILTQESYDYILLIGHGESTDVSFRLLDSAGYKTVLYNGELAPESFDEFRNGETRLKHWIGQILPNEKQAGYLLAEKLIEQRQRDVPLDTNEKLEVLAITGHPHSPTAKLRVQGMEKYLETHKNIILNDVVYANWSRNYAKAKTYSLAKEYPNTSVIWVGSDEMALGVTEAMSSMGNQPGIDFLIGGVDWLPGVVESITNGSICCSVGGHVYDGAWALVTIHDHYHGFIKGFFDIRTTFDYVAKGNEQRILSIHDSQIISKVNFKAWSKSTNTENEYNFGVEKILENLK